MSELDILEEYLKVNDIEYTRIDDVPAEMIEVMKQHGVYQEGMFERHQIIAYKDGKRSWDAICHYGSYGFSHGLLEVSGSITTDDVEGWLTADDIIRRIVDERD